MTATLLNLVVNHLRAAPDLLAGYTPRYFRWTDAELKGGGGYALFRSAGTGRSDYTVLKTDVSIRLIDDAANAVAIMDAMEAIRGRFFERFNGVGVFHFQPMTEVLGPSYLQNDRVIADLTVRTMRGQP